MKTLFSDPLLHCQLLAEIKPRAPAPLAARIRAKMSAFAPPEPFLLNLEAWKQLFPYIGLLAPFTCQALNDNQLACSATSDAAKASAK